MAFAPESQDRPRHSETAMGEDTMSKKVPEIPPGTPDCLCCHDSGIVDHSGGYRFCLCRAGTVRSRREPDAVEQANAVRSKLGL